MKESKQDKYKNCNDCIHSKCKINENPCWTCMSSMTKYKPKYEKKENNND